MTKSDLWYVPGLRQQEAQGRFARALSLGSGMVFISLALAIYLNVYHRHQFSNHEQQLIFGSISAVVLLILLALVTLSWPLRILAVAVYIAPWLYAINVKLSLGATVGLPLAYLLLFFSSWRYAASHRDLPGSPLDWRLRSLGAHLPGWKAYLPRTPSASQARVLVSPAGETFLVGINWARLDPQYGQEHLSWTGMGTDTVRTLAKQEAAAAQQGQHVLWIIPPYTAVGEYPPSLDKGVSIVIADTEAFAQQLTNWSAMRTRLHEPASSASEHGRAVEDRAIMALEEILPADWTLRRNVLLAQGGDADLHLTAPSDQQYVIDIKSRTDRFDLTAPKGDRAVSWQEIHDQVVKAARQLGGVGVVWQSEARDEDTRRVGTVWCQRGSAKALLAALLVLDAGHLTAKTVPPHEVLGVPENATLTEIREAYRNQVKQYHPDRLASLGPEFRLLAEQRTKVINAAYQAMLDRKR